MHTENKDLVNQIARISSFGSESLDVVRAEILRANVPWIEEYGEYQSGGWWTASLFNHSGDPTDVRIRDGTGVPTSLLERMPHTLKFIEGLGFKVMWARLARLSSNSFLWEHVDYGELDEVERHRLHIPLMTNSSAQFVIAGRSLNLAIGHLWRLAPSNPHGVCNSYGPDRIHIVIDCYENATLHDLIEQKQLSDMEAHYLPPIGDARLSQAIQSAGKLLDLGFPRAAEKYLLRLFFEHSMPAGMSYDLIIDLYRSREMKEAAMSWKEKKKIMLGENQ